MFSYEYNNRNSSCNNRSKGRHSSSTCKQCSCSKEQGNGG
nr:MAG TPA: hypothetical protein [Caudoviricetes sp.]